MTMRVQWFVGAALIAVTAAACADSDKQPDAGRSVNDDSAVNYSRVVDVAAADVLNIRAAPDSGAVLMGAIPPGAAALTLGERDSWFKVVYKGRSGWVYGKYITPVEAPVFADAGLEGLVCTGTEPHWTLKVAGERVVYGMYGDSRPYYLDTAITSAVNRRGLWYATTYSPAAGEYKGPAELDIVLESDGRCSDGMSDALYEYSVFVINANDDLLGGCCSLPDGAGL